MYNPLVDKFPYGATQIGIKNIMRFTLDARSGIKSIFVVLRKSEHHEKFELQDKSLIDGNIVFSGSFILDEPGIWFYRFEGILPDGSIAFFGADAQGNAIRGDWLPEWQLTVSRKNIKTPLWAKSGVVYHAFADRFYGVNREAFWKKAGKDGTFHKSWDEPLVYQQEGKEYKADDYYGGNAKGIIEKLPYLQSLGVTQLYLSPIFEAHSNHRYDTADYLKIDPLFGTEQDFKELVSKAKNAGIRIILDGVFNHTGSDSIYFNKNGRYKEVGAYQSKSSKYYDWYNFTSYPDEYDCWWGCTVVPTVNKAAPSWRELILGEGGVIEKWFKFGIKGWRLDVIDELPTEFMQTLYKKIKKIDVDSLVIGEVWEDASTKISYGTWRPYMMGGEIDGTMNYPFRQAILDFTLYGDAKAFETAVYTICNNYPKEVLDVCYNNIGTHDTIRALTALANVDLPETKKERAEYKLSKEQYSIARQRLMFASWLQYLLPGIPCIFYGDEAGQQGFEDPLNRKTFPWGNEDKKLINHYRNLGAFRKKYEKFLNGETSFTFAEDGLIEFRRKSGVGELLIIANSSNEIKAREVNGVWFETESEKVAGKEINIAPLEVEILYKEAPFQTDARLE